MWTTDNIKARPNKMDFTSSGQSIIDVTSIYADDQLLVNACELIDFEHEPYQFVVCSHCGYTQCERGNWLNVGAALDHVFFYPAFGEMEEGEWESNEYTPPYFTKTKGSLYFPKKTYEEIQNHLTKLQPFGKLKNITPYEIARILQWEAPYRVLGEYPETVEFKDRLFVTSSSESDEEVVSILQRLISALLESNEHVFIPFTSEMEKVSFFLEGSDFIEWVPMVKHENGYGIIVNDAITIFKAENS